MRAESKVWSLVVTLCPFHYKRATAAVLSWTGVLTNAADFLYCIWECQCFKMLTVFLSLKTRGVKRCIPWCSKRDHIFLFVTLFAFLPAAAAWFISSLTISFITSSSFIIFLNAFLFDHYVLFVGWGGVKMQPCILRFLRMGRPPLRIIQKQLIFHLGGFTRLVQIHIRRPLRKVWLSSRIAFVAWCAAVTPNMEPHLMKSLSFSKVGGFLYQLDHAIAIA